MYSNKIDTIMGLDFGSKTVGVAISDTLGLIAHPFVTIKRERESKLRTTFAKLREIIEKYDIKKIILGLPLNNDDSYSIRATKTLEFKNLIEKKFELPVVLVNETLTTVESDILLKKCGIPCDKRKKYLDSLAAAIILQEYLDNLKFYEKENRDKIYE